MNTSTRWDAVEAAARKSLAITWDGCHKIYLAMDAGEVRQFEEYGYDLVYGTPTEKAALLRQWYNDSCGLRFISAVESNLIDPNAGFTYLIPQGWDEDEDENEDEQCYCAECCSEGHCSCEKCNEPCTCVA